jgi:uncharacterized membrane protein YGL010W
MPTSLEQNYKSKHTHPLNRLSHSIGIPLIVVSLPLFFLLARRGTLCRAILQFVGHAIEGNQPPFLRIQSTPLIGPLWLIRRLAVALGVTNLRQ